MNELVIKNEEDIKNMIYEIRGKQVMLDSDLAKLYQVETKRINEAVKNNPLKFPERYSFILKNQEHENLRSKISTSSLPSHGGRRYNPRVFTEQGVAMLATILKSKIATEVSIAIMDAFVLARHLILNNEKLFNNLLNINNRLDNYENKLIEHDNNFDKIFKLLENKPEKEIIFYDGEIFDAYAKIVELFKLAKEKLIVIDNYADLSFLEMIKNLNIKVILITKEKGLLKDIDIKKYNSEYHNLTIIRNNTFHDRFIIIDENIIFHCGTSLNKAGTRTFAINEIENNSLKKTLINILSPIIKKDLELIT